MAVMASMFIMLSELTGFYSVIVLNLQGHKEFYTDGTQSDHF